VGFFRHFNTGPDNLSRYGIFSEFKLENYESNCVVQAFRNCRKFTAEEVEFIRSIVKVWRIPLKQLTVFAQLFRCKIFLHGGEVNHRPFIPHALKNPMQTHREIRNVNFYVFEGHLMVDAIGLPEKLDRATFRQMNDDELNQIAWMKRYEVSRAMAYPECAIQTGVSRKNIPWRGLDTFLTFDDLKKFEDKELIFDQYRELMISRYQQDPRRWITLAEFSAALFDPCLVEIPELRGSVCEFIRKCNKPPILGTRYGEVMKLEGDYVQLDRCGSYTSVYCSSPTPISPPVLISGEKFEDYPYYFIQVNVVKFSCKHPIDPFPMLLTSGVVYVEKTWWECFRRHYDVEYEFISGYYFCEVKNTVGELAEDLWELRMKAKKEGNEGLQLMLKRTLNSLWGKTMWQGKPIQDVMMNVGKVAEFVENNPLVYSTKRMTGDLVRVRVIKPIWMPWQRPQFGVSILSKGRTVMQDLTYTAEVYYCNTDSLLVRREDVRKFPLGEKLGTFHVEYEIKKFICLSPKKWFRVLIDGTTMHSFGKNNELWFEEAYLVNKAR
jgi:hypothetical protein